MAEDPDRDTEPELQTDPRFDNWPAEYYDAYSDWPVEREVPDEDTVKREEIDADWVGYAGKWSVAASEPLFYDHDRNVVMEGEIDEENERIVVREDHERRDVGDASLGERIEEFSEEHGWTWLASFAREHLEGEGDVETVPEPEHSEFNRRNLLDSAEQDLSYVASHTFRDAGDTVFTLERDFDVYLDDGDADSARVTVDEEVLVAERPRAEERAGDADILQENEYGFEVTVDPEDPTPEATVEGELKDWHAANVTPRSPD